jgi:hypothetical protein
MFENVLDSVRKWFYSRFANGLAWVCWLLWTKLLKNLASTHSSLDEDGMDKIPG